eukprot:3610884-Rhodomonas_salina.2
MSSAYLGCAATRHAPAPRGEAERPVRILPCLTSLPETSARFCLFLLVPARFLRGSARLGSNLLESALKYVLLCSALLCSALFCTTVSDAARAFTSPHLALTPPIRAHSHASPPSDPRASASTPSGSAPPTGSPTLRSPIFFPSVRPCELNSKATASQVQRAQEICYLALISPGGVFLGPTTDAICYGLVSGTEV